MKKRIIIAGGTGLIGSRFIEMLDKSHYEINVLSRNQNEKNPDVNFLKWDPENEDLDLSHLEPIHAIINLSGAGIAEKRWSKSRKKLILESRLNSVSTIQRVLEKLDSKAEIYIGASAIGFYGDRGESILTEADAPGNDFLSMVCQKWESAHQALIGAVKRVSILRIGIVLSMKGGAMHEIINKSIFKIHCYFGDGKDYYSWIHIDDLCRIMLNIISDNKSEGIYNACSKNPVTNRDLVNAISKSRSAFGYSLTIPKLILRIVLGELSDSLLVSIRAIPNRLSYQNFEFKFKSVESAVKDILKRKV